MDAAIRSGTTRYGDAYYNESTFSIGVFSAHDDGLLYQKHHTDSTVANSSAGVHSVDANTVYRLGSTSKVFTVLTFLAQVGDRRFGDPVTDHLPELLTPVATAGGGTSPKWDKITLGDLASLLAGIVRDCSKHDGMQSVTKADRIQMASTIGPSHFRRLMVAILKAVHLYLQIKFQYVDTLIQTLLIVGVHEPVWRNGIRSLLFQNPNRI